jgi:hypothetical protein
MTLSSSSLLLYGVFVLILGFIIEGPDDRPFVTPTRPTGREVLRPLAFDIF